MLSAECLKRTNTGNGTGVLFGQPSEDSLSVLACYLTLICFVNLCVQLCVKSAFANVFFVLYVFIEVVSG